MVLDLKDCFFSIPLAEQDREAFAFTLPSVNNQAPADNLFLGYSLFPAVAMVRGSILGRDCLQGLGLRLTNL